MALRPLLLLKPHKQSIVDSSLLMLLWTWTFRVRNATTVALIVPPCLQSRNYQKLLASKHTNRLRSFGF